MRDADAVIEVIIQVCHRWSPWSDPCERLLRHPADRETLSIVADRVLGWALDLRKRNSSCKYWERIATALADVGKTGRIHFGLMPDGLLLRIMQRPTGYFEDSERTSAIEALESCLHAARHDRPSSLDGRLMTEAYRLSPHRRRRND